MQKQYRIVALPGEGIGIEVMAGALEILLQLAKQQGFGLTIDYGVIGESADRRFGKGFPEVTAQLCEGADGILLGAVANRGLLELRHHFDFFINLRPIQTFPVLLDCSALKNHKLPGVDILLVRELSSGIYYGSAGRAVDGKGEYGYHTMHYSDGEIRRIAQVALKQAQRRRGLLTIVHKENALPHLPWTRLVQTEAEAFAGVTVAPMLVDNCALQLMLNPQQFDVILAGNLFGDILSDLGGALVGSIGLLGSASLNGSGLGLYEPVHGTAPDIAGKGVANPIGMLSSVILMLEQWQEWTAAKRLSHSIQNVLAQGYRTADLLTHHQAAVTTQAFIERLSRELTIAVKGEEEDSAR